MALNKQDIEVLEQIVDLNGKCMDSLRCSICPFRAMCLPEFLNPTPPSTNYRLSIALDILTHQMFMGEEVEVEDYRWKR